MSDWFYPCAFSCWGGEEVEAFRRVMASGRYTMHDECAAFEVEFAQYHHMRHAIMVNSGSSANLVATAALFHLSNNPLRPGDKAIVPAIAWSTTYAPLVQYGLDLVVADVDATWNAHCTENRIRWEVYQELHPRIVVGCSVLGNPGHLVLWKEFLGVTAAQKGEAYFIEDNAESLGAQVGTMGNLKRCGTFGLMNTFSFFHSHQLSAIEGGMILTDDDECAMLCRLLRNHGNAGFASPTDDFAGSYDFRLMGYNVRPLEMHAAIARAQLPKLEDFCKVRQQNLNNFALMAEGLPIQLQRRNVPGIPSPFGIAFTVDSKYARSRLVASLRRDSIDCRLPTGGSFLRHQYAARWRDSQVTPVADEIHDRGLFLGNAPFDIYPQIEHAVKVIRETL